MKPIVVMGVAGCGKSTLGSALAAALGCPLIDGDAYHSVESREKMEQGIPLTDSDREAWLEGLGQELAKYPQGAILTCSALKRSYRDVLRRALPGLRFVFMEISLEDAQARTAARKDHFFLASLVSSQFEALEPPMAESDVATVKATEPTEKLVQTVLVSFGDP